MSRLNTVAELLSQLQKASFFSFFQFGDKEIQRRVVCRRRRCAERGGGEGKRSLKFQILACENSRRWIDKMEW